MSDEAPRVAQVGGQHYAEAEDVENRQHWDFMEVYDIAYLEGTGTKYVVRYDRKGAPIQDLEKGISYFEKMLAYRRGPRRTLPIGALQTFCEANRLDEFKRHMVACTIGPGANEATVYYAVNAMKARAEIERGLA